MKPFDNKRKKYYKILGLSENASDSDIRKAYKKLACKYHPDKNKDPGAEQKFKEICKAYMELTENKDENRQQPHQTFDYNHHIFSDNDDILNNFSFNIKYVFSPSNLSSFLFSESSSSSSSNNYTPFKNAQKEMIFKDLRCTLKEIMNGTIKYVDIIVCSDNIQGKIEKEKLKIRIHPGWKEGTRITFQEKGISFTIKDEPHPFFKRDGSNLIYVAPITLKDALCGSYNSTINDIYRRKIVIPINLDGSETKTLILEKNEIITPQSKKILPKLGLPYPKNIQERGDIIVKFDILFPSTLTRNMKMGIANLLNSDREEKMEIG